MPDGATVVQVLAVAATIIVAGLGLAGVVYTARAARASNKRTAEIEQSKLDTTRWQAQVDSWRSDVAQLRADRKEDEQRHQEQIAALRERMTRIETVAEEERRARFELITWARNVVALLRQAQISYPAPPPGVADTDPGIPRLRGI